MGFQLKSKFKPTGDQPQAIKKLTDGILSGVKNQVLLGVTGSGKTFTIANAIKNVNRPTLVISHNKTLAGQLYQELRDFFPKDAVSYFVSYYDYYQPEAYIPQTDTYISKETEINEEIDKLRLAATTNILTQSNTIVVASVSCIYNLGSPTGYENSIFKISKGDTTDRKDLMNRFIDLMYQRNDYNFKRGTFRARGEVIELFPAYEDLGIRIVLEEEKINSIEKVNPLTGEILEKKESLLIYPAKHYITDQKSYEVIFEDIRSDLKKRAEELKKLGKNLEAQRLTQKVEYDLRMIKEVGYVNGIENYSRYFDGRKPGEAPYSLLEYFEMAAKNWLLVVDESHMTIPQIRGMYNGDRARKQVLIDYGFRLPSAFDNRPLNFSEFQNKIHQTIHMSATPSIWEIDISGKNNIVEQLIRPTGIVDPEIIVKKTEGQIQDLIKEISLIVKKSERALVTTLTKRMAEDLATFLEEKGIKVAYLHSEVNTLDRQDVLDNLREGKFDVLVGINLLREGLDLPEVSRVFILDADKEGFLRSRTSLIQTMGRAARRIDSKVIMYADNITDSMKNAIREVDRRRKRQLDYNKKHKITPKTVKKVIRAKLIEREGNVDDDMKPLFNKEFLFPEEREKAIKILRQEMQEAARMLDFETAALLRDKIKFLLQK
ncbi:MAG: excinuclease ABC subunit B [Candidatus Levybacteria bacterium RIFCSPHIGHO2_01_FULL_36_15]|nr:MAG: excinuclease ABC subunit B [Candidatus Levybacteria bacterium RIFCSPHIGHO2_01_FULL_36_15]OGH37235.1 MAG: excinuclease ABC subunit B [Candidatus Levybacteria bacterium RIFCSPLOWO2_01_FULL_36_10]